MHNCRPRWLCIPLASDSSLNTEIIAELDHLGECRILMADHQGIYARKQIQKNSQNKKPEENNPYIGICDSLENLEIAFFIYKILKLVLKDWSIAK